MNIYLRVITVIANDFSKIDVFHDEPKSTEVRFFSEKGDPLNKPAIYQLVFFFASPKFFERIIYNQISEYMEPFLTKLLTRFRKIK